jgi:hypothetical protein
VNQYPPEAYNPYHYQTQQVQSVIAIATGAIMLVGLAAWAFSLIRKSAKGEEVKFPL